MSINDPVEMYTDEQALGIYDESIRIRRQMRASVLTNAFVVGSFAGFFGLFVWTQALQRDVPAAATNPDLVMMPANGSLLTSAFSALLAVILAVWFSPNTFRLGTSESPSTIARELTTRLIATLIARLCVMLSLGLAAWAVLTSASSEGPRHVDLVRMVLPILLGFAFAYWAAAAEVRIGEVPNQRLRWAQHTRAAERLERITEGENAAKLSKRAKFVQRMIAFGGIPPVVWFIGLLIVPAPTLPAAILRLVMAIVVTIVGYFALRELTYRLIGRQLWAAVLLVFALLVFGFALWAATTSAVIPSGGPDDAFHLAPLARSTLLFTVLTLSGPFIVLAAFTVRRLHFGRWRALIFDSVMRRYEDELAEEERRVTRISDTHADPNAAPERQRTKPVAWAAVAALIPIPPFHFMFAALALRATRDGEARGRKLATAAIVIGVVVAVALSGLLVYAVWSDPTLVPCEPESTAVCLR